MSDFDLVAVPGLADDPARAAHRQDDRDRGPVEHELRASYFVGYYLKRHGYRVIP